MYLIVMKNANNLKIEKAKYIYFLFVVILGLNVIWTRSGQIL